MDRYNELTNDSNGAVETGTLGVEQTSQEYLGRWNRLVSTTNWEKGRIIFEWRQALIREGVPGTAYSDDAWSQRVGNVSPQHVGRLRRVHERFGEQGDRYVHLFWSHFQAALDWDDAEMWLEGASQSSWSVSQMREQRGQTMDAVARQGAPDEDVAMSEIDEDAGPAESIPDAMGNPFREVRSTDRESAAVGEAAPWEAETTSDSSNPADAPAEGVRPFENLPQLPEDVHDAFESFKLTILNHKLSGWQNISCDTLLAVLDSLKQLAMAPAD